MKPAYAIGGLALALAGFVGFEAYASKKKPSSGNAPTSPDEPIPPPGDKPIPGTDPFPSGYGHPEVHVSEFSPEFANARVWETSTPGQVFISLVPPATTAPFVDFIGPWLVKARAGGHHVFFAEDAEVGVPQPAYFARLDSAPLTWSELVL